MSNVVLVSTKYPKGAGNEWLTNELAEYAAAQEHAVSVVVLSWDYDDGQTENYTANDVDVFRVRLPAFFYYKNVFCAFLKILLFSFYARFKTSHVLRQADVLIASTPCVATWAFFTGRPLKAGAKSFLILWDFFPFYMNGLWGWKKVTFPFFLWVENYLYKKFDYIGCMTKGNKAFLLDKYRGVDSHRIVDLPLWTKQVPKPELSKQQARSMLGIDEKAFVVIYGGAMSVVQGLDCIVELADRCREDCDILFLMVGRGSERSRLQEKAADLGLANIRFVEFVPRNEYEAYVCASDLGLISLAASHQVPSFPSKSIDYLKVGLPILASLDTCTDFGNVLVEDMQAGLWVEAGDIDALTASLYSLRSDSEQLAVYGKNGRSYYEKSMNVSVGYNNIFRFL